MHKLPTNVTKTGKNNNASTVIPLIKNARIIVG